MKCLLYRFLERSWGIRPFEIKQTPQLDYSPPTGLLLEFSDILIEGFMLTGQGLFFRADSLMGPFTVEWPMVAWCRDALFPRQKLAVMFGNDGPTVINDHLLPVFQYFDILADQGVGHRVAIGVKMDVSLDIHCPLRGQIDRRQYFR